VRTISAGDMVLCGDKGKLFNLQKNTPLHPSHG